MWQICSHFLASTPNGLLGTASRWKAGKKGEKIYFTLWHMLNQLSRQMLNITEGKSVVEGCRSLKQKQAPWLDFLHRQYTVSNCAEITCSKGVVKEMTLAGNVRCTQPSAHSAILETCSKFSLTFIIETSAAQSITCKSLDRECLKAVYKLFDTLEAFNMTEWRKQRLEHLSLVMENCLERQIVVENVRSFKMA